MDDVWSVHLACCAALSAGKAHVYTHVFCARRPHLQSILTCDLSEGLAVLACGLGNDLLRHSNAILALETRVGQPVTEVLLSVVSFDPT